MTPAKVMIILTSIAAAFFLMCVIITTISTAQEKSRAETVKFTKRVYSKRGIVKGFHVDYGSNRNELFFGSADIFLGIPFAQPPVGALRFKLPQPVHKYTREEGELVYKPKCAQANDLGQVTNGSSEDCLYLNVFTPNVTGKYPVIVSIHGGSFVARGADDFHYKGAVRNFVSNGVVVVTIQYRLGPFGFFTTFTPDFPANLGLFDQILALKWVKQEILAFGGDPNQITLYGQSAGAISASGLSLSLLTRGLFNRLIMNSGSVLVSFFVPNDPRGSIQQLRAAQWCNVTEDLMTSPTAPATLTSCLANLSTEEILKYDAALSLPRALRWAPVRDGAIFPDDPEVLALSRPAYNALLMDMPVEQAMFDPVYKSGNVSGFGPNSLKKALLNRHYGYLSDAQLDRMVDILIANYKTSELDDNDHLAWFKQVMHIISAERYTNHGRLEAQWLKAGGSRTYLSIFTYEKRICGMHSAIPGYDPTTHYTDVCYIWFTSAEWEKAASDGKVTARDRAVADNFARVYSQFVKNGTTGWSESGNDYQWMHFNDSLDQMGKNWRAHDNYVFTEALPIVIGANPPIKLAEGIVSALKLNGELVLNSWEQLLNSRPP
ncbi:hypothetical protein PRIPAC_77424 [Pristionchus pacificus]|nr:hypothetical protein PRIPAC_77424 [Pristionchus pacificus]